jgi:hypothetical protein
VKLHPRFSANSLASPLHLRCLGLIALVWPLMTTSPEMGAERSAPKVDLELVLAVDVSSSMTGEEQRIQRVGYANALRSAEVLQAIRSGPRGKIAIIFFEWARPGYQRILLPWTIIDGPDAAAASAATIENQSAASEGGTSISAALLLAAGLLQTTELQGDRQVIDVSGDGPNNAGPYIAPIRDGLIADGVTINGLAISLPPKTKPRRLDYFGPQYIEAYYKGCVIGGSDAFVVVVAGVEEFEVAIRRKLAREIAGAQPRVQFAASDGQHFPMDCHALGDSPGR